MHLIDAIVSAFNPEAGVRRAAARASLQLLANQSMNYEAAGKGRRAIRSNGDPSAKTLSRGNMIQLRKNMRELARNNFAVKSAVSAKTRHTIGGGIRPNVTTLKKTGKKRVEELQKLINEWAKSTSIDLYGMHNLYGLESLAYRTMNMSGEALIIKKISDDPNAILPLQLKLIEGDQLDHTRNGTNPETGNEIIEGVEFNDQERPVAYWIFPHHPGDIGFYRRHTMKSNRIPASSVIHLFETLRPGQVRGLPRGVATANKAKNLDEFQDARIEQMKVAACLVGAVSDTSQAPGAAAQSAGDPLPTNMAPGMLLRLRRGESIAFNQPPNVSGQHDFITEELHAIASDWGITYQALTGDLKQVNFTSGRMGWLDMYREVDNDRQLILYPLMLNRIWEWLQESLELIGKPARDIQCEWIPPRREMFDPTKEIPPLVKAIRAGLKPPQRALMEQGDDPDNILSQYSEWNNMLDNMKLIFDSDPRRVSGAGNTNPEPAEEKPDDEETGAD